MAASERYNKLGNKTLWNQYMEPYLQYRVQLRSSHPWKDINRLKKLWRKNHQDTTIDCDKRDDEHRGEDLDMFSMEERGNVSSRHYTAWFKCNKVEHNILGLVGLGLVFNKFKKKHVWQASVFA